MISIRFDTSEVERDLTEIERKHVPYATAQALNATAIQGQVAVQESLDDSFTLRRRDWARRSIKMRREDFAKKTDLAATVRVETPGDPARSDILEKFEKGGTKTPEGQSLAIPHKARSGKKGVVRKGMRPKDFMFEYWGSGPRGEIYRGRDRTFMIRRADGTGGIYQRKGKATKAGKSAGRRRMKEGRDLNIKTLYRFTPEAHIDSRLHFEETMRGVVRARFSANLDIALTTAINGGRVRVEKDGTMRATPGARRIAKADVLSMDRVPRRKR
jgi:hypothetical protein